MSPELLVWMFETIDNLTMVKGSTGDLSRMQRVDWLSGGRLPFCNGINPLVLDALQARAAGWCTAGPGPRPQPCIDLYGAVRQANCQGHKPFTLSSSRCWSSSSATTAEAGLGLLGAGVGDPSRPLPPLDDEGRVALKKPLADA